MTGIVFGGGGSGSLAALNNAATSTDILKNKKAYNDKGDVITGAIISKGAETFAASADGDRVISGGQYLAGDQVIKAVQTETKNAGGCSSYYGVGTILPSAGKFLSSVDTRQFYVNRIQKFAYPVSSNQISVSFTENMIVVAVCFFRKDSTVQPQSSTKIINGIAIRKSAYDDGSAAGRQISLASSGTVYISALGNNTVDWGDQSRNFSLTLENGWFDTSKEYNILFIGLSDTGEQ